MGGKSSNFVKTDPPDSGGADRGMQFEKSGLKERDKQRFAVDQQKRDQEQREKNEDAVGE